MTVTPLTAITDAQSPINKENYSNRVVRLKSAFNLSVLFFISFKMQPIQADAHHSDVTHPWTTSCVFVRRDNSGFSHNSRCNRFGDSYFCSDNNCSREDLARKGKKSFRSKQEALPNYEHARKQKQHSLLWVRTNMHWRSWRKVYPRTRVWVPYNQESVTLAEPCWQNQQKAYICSSHFHKQPIPQAIRMIVKEGWIDLSLMSALLSACDIVPLEGLHVLLIM